MCPAKSATRLTASERGVCPTCGLDGQPCKKKDGAITPHDVARGQLRDAEECDVGSGSSGLSRRHIDGSSGGDHPAMCALSPSAQESSRTERVRTKDERQQVVVEPAQASQATRRGTRADRCPRRATPSGEISRGACRRRVHIRRRGFREAGRGAKTLPQPPARDSRRRSGDAESLALPAPVAFPKSRPNYEISSREYEEETRYPERGDESGKGDRSDHQHADDE